MATEYISREEAEERLDRLERESHHNSVLWPDHVEECREALREIEPAYVVSRDCYDRILAENDAMREMLAQIGKKPGDKMDDVRIVARGNWIKSNRHLFDLDEQGRIDLFAFEFEYHNGPHCKKCGRDICEHCEPDYLTQSCEVIHYVCPMCGEISMEAKNYCPNCGAKMTEVKDG